MAEPARGDVVCFAVAREGGGPPRGVEGRYAGTDHADAEQAVVLVPPDALPPGAARLRQKKDEAGRTVTYAVARVRKTALTTTPLPPSRSKRQSSSRSSASAATSKTGAVVSVAKLTSAKLAALCGRSAKPAAAPPYVQTGGAAASEPWTRRLWPAMASRLPANRVERVTARARGRQTGPSGGRAHT